MLSRAAHLNPRRFLIPIAVILAVMVVGRWAHERWTDHLQTLQQGIDMREMQLAQYTRIVENSARYESLNQALHGLREETRQRHLFSASTEALAQARFQTLVKELSRKNNIDIRTTKTVPSNRQDDFSLLRLRIDAKAEIGNIRDFLLDLRNDDHYIFVSDLEIRVINSREDRYFYLTAELEAIQDI